MKSSFFLFYEKSDSEQKERASADVSNSGE